MASPEERRKMAWLMGISVDELDRREQVALHARTQKVPGGTLMFAADGRHDAGYDAVSDASMDARGCVQAAKEHLAAFEKEPTAIDAHEHIARASAMLAAAASRLARDNAEHARIASGRGLMASRGF